MNATRRFGLWFSPAVLLSLLFAIPTDRAIGADRALDAFPGEHLQHAGPRLR